LDRMHRIGLCLAIWEIGEWLEEWTFSYIHPTSQQRCGKFGLDIAGFVSKCHFCTYPLVFHPKFGDVPLELDR